MPEENSLSRLCTAFAGSRQIAAGPLEAVTAQVKALSEQAADPILIFDDSTGAVVDVDWREEAVAEAPRRAGRPKLGVVAREVTLLPRHWEWLNGQPGGASVALRKLVEHARRENEVKERVRAAQEAAYRFLTATAGNESGFEEAMRALFRGERDRFDRLIAPWPEDIRNYGRRLAQDAF